MVCLSPYFNFHILLQLLFLKSVCAMAPMALAAFVAVSRIADYKHAPCDVNAGW